MTLILTQIQAEAVYRAMCALNNACGRIDVGLPSGRVKEYANGSVQVWKVHGMARSEEYANQTAFASAYGLQ